MADDTLSTAAIELNGWSLSSALQAQLKPMDRDGIVHELGDPGRTLDNYRARLSFHGMTGHNRILDFGCGFGQWSVAMAHENRQVLGVDKAKQRLAVADDLRRQAGVKNLNFADELDAVGVDAAPGSFDAIFCYSVFMFLPGEFFIQRFAKLLRPGGRLYIMIDLPGWHLRTVMNKPRALLGVGYMALNTLLGRSRNVIYTRRSIERLITSAGFRVVEAGPDYTTSFLPISERPPRVDAIALDGQTLFLPILHEVCAERL